jgi:hypothetical protein
MRLERSKKRQGMGKPKFKVAKATLFVDGIKIGTFKELVGFDPPEIKVHSFEEVQKQFCEKTNNSLFMPINGVCWKCHKYIFDDKETTEKAHCEVITGCPFCNKSFLD